MNSRHALVRAQQRGIKPIIDHWLDIYGRQQYDGHGALLIYLDRRGKQLLQKNENPRLVRRHCNCLNAYKVVSSHDGTAITFGRRWKHIKRP